MDLLPTTEQDDLRETARSFLTSATAGDRDAVLDIAPHWDPAIWPRIAELGWLGVSVPEAAGGTGLGLAEEAVLLEEAAAALLPAPLATTITLALPLLMAGDDRALLLAVADGTTIATLAWVEDDPQARPAFAARALTVRAARISSGWCLHGAKRWIPDAVRADVLLVTAATDDGPRLFAVAAADVDLAPRDTIDALRPLADAELRGAAGTEVLGGAALAGALAGVRTRALVLAAAEAVGICRATLQLARDHASERRQFDRAIGTYQAISHRIADMYVDLELSRSLVRWAALLVDASDELAHAAACAAAAKALPSAVRAAEAAIQVFGGIGVTWESPLHRHLKHAISLAAIDTGPSMLRREALTLAPQGLARV